MIVDSTYKYFQYFKNRLLNVLKEEKKKIIYKAEENQIRLILKTLFQIKLKLRTIFTHLW